MSFNCLKELLISAPIIVAPDWLSTSELMCDKSKNTLGEVLVECIENLFYPIYYASKTLTDAQRN